VKYHGNLDLLRALAVLTVFVGHLLHTNGYIPRWVSEMSHFGVIAFFVHTACVLMMSLQRLVADGRGATTLRFFIRRAFRIYPLSVSCVLLVVIAGIPRTPWQPERVLTNWKLVVANVALIQNVWGGSVLAPLWSLPFEIQMYLLLPPIFYSMSLLSWRRILCVTLWLAGVAVALSPLRKFTAFFPCFLSGVVAYGFSLQCRRALPWQTWPLFLVALWAAVAKFGNDYAWLDWMGSACLGAALPFFAEIRPTWLRAASATIAKYSYGIYLSHLPLMWLVFVRLAFLPSTSQWLLFAVLSCVLPVLLFHFIEQPMISKGTRIAELRSEKAFTFASGASA
jgi:peptidoglycan/LPS O-acetylase OafA/YrhL